MTQQPQSIQTRRAALARAIRHRAAAVVAAFVLTISLAPRRALGQTTQRHICSESKIPTGPARVLEESGFVGFVQWGIDCIVYTPEGDAATSAGPLKSRSSIVDGQRVAYITGNGSDLDIAEALVGLAARLQQVDEATAERQFRRAHHRFVSSGRPPARPGRYIPNPRRHAENRPPPGGAEDLEGITPPDWVAATPKPVLEPKLLSPRMSVPSPPPPVAAATEASTPSRLTALSSSPKPSPKTSRRTRSDPPLVSGADRLLLLSLPVLGFLGLLALVMMGLAVWMKDGGSEPASRAPLEVPPPSPQSISPRAPNEVARNNSEPTAAMFDPHHLAADVARVEKAHPLTRVFVKEGILSRLQKRTEVTAAYGRFYQTANNTFQARSHLEQTRREIEDFEASQQQRRKHAEADIAKLEAEKAEAKLREAQAKEATRRVKKRKIGGADSTVRRREDYGL